MVINAWLFCLSFCFLFLLHDYYDFSPYHLPSMAVHKLERKEQQNPIHHYLFLQLTEKKNIRHRFRDFFFQTPIEIVSSERVNFPCGCTQWKVNLCFSQFNIFLVRWVPVRRHLFRSTEKTKRRRRRYLYWSVALDNWKEFKKFLHHVPDPFHR